MRAPTKNRSRDLRGVLLGLLFLIPACNTPGKGYRPTTIDPNTTLLSLYDKYKQGVDSRDNIRGSLLYDPEFYQRQIQQLSMQFPRHVATLFTCAAICYQEREYDEAASYLDSLFYIEPRHAEAGILRSRIALREGNLTRAASTLEQQIVYTPDNAGLREAFGAVLFLLEDFDAAGLELEMASRLGAPSWRVNYNLGLIREAEGLSDEAMAFYAMTVAEHPEFVQALSRLDGLRAEAGEEIR